MENYNKKLLEYYSQWLKTIDKSFFAEHFSNPYFITAPTDWDNAKYRIMIIGEEGYGNWGAGKKDGWNPNEKTGIEKIMGYNEEYLKGQIIDRKNYKDYNSSAFWTRVSSYPRREGRTQEVQPYGRCLHSSLQGYDLRVCKPERLRRSIRSRWFRLHHGVQVPASHA